MKNNVPFRISLFLFAIVAMTTHFGCSKLDYPGGFPEEEESTIPPVADFVILSNENAGITVQKVQDTAKTSYGWRFYWDFGDGSPTKETYSASSTLFHRYYNKGEYNITLEVRFISDTTIHYSKTVSVSVDPAWELIGRLPNVMLNNGQTNKENIFFNTANGIFALRSDLDKDRVYQMDTTTGEWIFKWSAPFNTKYMQTAVIDDRVYFGCGRTGLERDTIYNAAYTPVDDFWMLDLQSGSWLHLPTFSQPVKSYTSFCAANDALYAFTLRYLEGEGDLWKYHPNQNTWTKECSFDGDSQSFTMAKLTSLKNSIFLVGGGDNDAKLWQYLESSAIWQRMEKLDHMAIDLDILSDHVNNRIYIGGGSYFFFNFNFEIGSWFSDSGGGGTSSGYARTSKYSIYNADDNTFGKWEWKLLPSSLNTNNHPGYLFKDGIFLNGVPYFISGTGNVFKYAP